MATEQFGLEHADTLRFKREYADQLAKEPTDEELAEMVAAYIRKLYLPVLSSRDRSQEN